MKSVILCIVFMLFQTLMWSQDYDQGFEYLNSGKFDQALVFFQTEVDNGCTDITCRLCYGRALGLTGSTEESKAIFKKLQSENPDNLEINLNLAEAYMWSKEFDIAEAKYENLLLNYPENFTANLGYANALSSLNRPIKAKKAIDYTLQLEPENQNALLSKKYIYLAYSNRIKLENREKESLQTLLEIDQIFPDDQDISSSLAFLYIDQKKYNKAVQKLKIIKEKFPNNPIAYLAEANIFQAKAKYNKALKSNKKAIEIYQNNEPNFELNQALVLQKINIRIAKKEFKEAKELIKTHLHDLDKANLEEIQVNYLIAKNDYKTLDKLIDKSTNPERQQKYEASKFLSLGDKVSSQRSIREIQSIDSLNVFAYYKNKEIKQSSYHEFYSKYILSSDNGDNDAKHLTAGYMSSDKKNHRLGFEIQNREVDDFVLRQSNIQQIALKLTKKIAPKWLIGISPKVIIHETSSDIKETNFVLNGFVDYKLNNFQKIGLAYQNLAFDYNPVMVDNVLFGDKFSFNYLSSKPKKIGVYSELFYRSISDGNTNLHAFLSLFKTVNEFPLLQFGINTTYFTYTEENPIYYSPTNFIASELYVKFNNEYQPNTNHLYGLSFAYGSQFVELDNPQTSTRFDAFLGYKIKETLIIKLSYQYVDALSKTVAPFKSTSYGLHVSLRL